MSPPRSALWKHFVKLSKDTVKCKICNKTVRSSGNTSNLHAHLKQKHRSFATSDLCDKESIEPASSNKQQKLCVATTSKSTELNTSVAVVSSEGYLSEGNRSPQLEVNFTPTWFVFFYNAYVFIADFYHKHIKV